MLLTGFLLLLIVFDAFQQKYYIDSFLTQEADDPVSIIELLKSHSLRWLVWGICGIPLVLTLRKAFRQSIHFDGPLSIRTGILTIITITLSLLSISAISMLAQNVEWSFTTFSEFLEFFIYQKGLMFFMAYATLILLLKSEAGSQAIDAQWVEIRHLEETTQHLSAALETATAPEKPHINIKVGYQVKPIPLDQVLWIQADDYCARIHTTDRVFTIRKSLKSFEKQLAPFGFIRIHRGALINLEYLDQVNFDESKLVLRNTDELPISKSGVQTLKQKLTQGSL